MRFNSVLIWQPNHPFRELPEPCITWQQKKTTRSFYRVKSVVILHPRSRGQRTVASQPSTRAWWQWMDWCWSTSMSMIPEITRVKQRAFWEFKRKWSSWLSKVSLTLISISFYYVRNGQYFCEYLSLILLWAKPIFLIWFNYTYRR